MSQDNSQTKLPSREEAVEELVQVLKDMAGVCKALDLTGINLVVIATMECDDEQVHAGTHSHHCDVCAYKVVTHYKGMLQDLILEKIDTMQEAQAQQMH